jgi:hypothetical protein
MSKRNLGDRRDEPWSAYGRGGNCCSLGLALSGAHLFELLLIDLLLISCSEEMKSAQPREARRSAIGATIFVFHEPQRHVI